MKKNHKTTTRKIRETHSLETKNRILSEWLVGWKKEQKELCENLDYALQIEDFDIMCQSIGALREVTKKRYATLYNCLPILTGNEKICYEGTIYYKFGETQTCLIGIIGKLVSVRDYDKAKDEVLKLLKLNNMLFSKLKKIIPFCIDN